MYVQDYDETYPLFSRWGANAPISVGGTPFSMWSYDILPYIKTQQIYADPMVGGITGNIAFYPYYTHYGYNYTVLSPYSGDPGKTPWVQTPASLTSVSRPTDVPMITGRMTREEAGAIYWYGKGTILTVGGSEAPDCGDINPWCFTDWAPDGNYSFLKTEEGGKFTGGVSARKQGNNNICFSDGHCKFVQAAQMAKGTNWFKGIKSGNVHILDNSIYPWTTQ